MPLFQRKRRYSNDEERWAPTAKQLDLAETIAYQSRPDAWLKGKTREKQVPQQPKKKTSTQEQQEKQQQQQQRMWRKDVDPKTKRTYYYHIKTKEKTYEKPDEIKRYEDTVKASKGQIQRSSSFRKTAAAADTSTVNTEETMATMTDVLESQNTDLMSEMEPEDFHLSFRANSAEYLAGVYEMEHTVHRSLVSGTLSFAFPQDIFHMVETQLDLLNDYLWQKRILQTTEGDRLLVDCLVSIFKNISLKHKVHHTKFMENTNLESCVAAANSFLWMIEKIDAFMESVEERYPHLRWNSRDPTTWLVCQKARDLVQLLGHDAVFAASDKAVFYIMEEMEESGIPNMLFSRQWEDDLVQNEVAVFITRIIEENLSQLSDWFEQDFLYHKLVGALMRATICLYVKGIVEKAGNVRKTRRSITRKARRKAKFGSTKRAIIRIENDIQVLQEYFQELTVANMSLAKSIEKEFSILVLLVECMTCAMKQSTKESMKEFIFLIHKETGANKKITKYFMSDIWILMGRKNQYLAVEDAVKTSSEELKLFSTKDDDEEDVNNNEEEQEEDVHFCLNEFLKTLYKQRLLSEKNIFKRASGSVKKKQEELQSMTVEPIKNFLEEQIFHLNSPILK